jgi:hypothetical protein
MILPQVEYEVVDLTVDTMIMNLDISAAIKATEGLTITPILGLDDVTGEMAWCFTLCFEYTPTMKW